MKRQEVSLTQFSTYFDDSGDEHLGHDFESVVLPIQEINANIINGYLVNCVLIPAVKTEKIEEWLEDPTEPFYIGSDTDIEEDGVVIHYELKHIHYIVPPFGPLGGKRIVIRQLPVDKLDVISVTAGDT